jgi:hypothetical protein
VTIKEAGIYANAYPTLDLLSLPSFFWGIKSYKYPADDHICDGYRRSVFGVDNIYYQLNGKVVEIMGVLGRQDGATLESDNN